MIKDKLDNFETYSAISENLNKGFEWLKSVDLNSVSDGKYQIDGENIYANVQTYDTKDDAPYEAHRKYIDIQYMVKGSENVGVTEYDRCSCLEKYDSEKDIEFLTYNGKEEMYDLQEGQFLVFFPQDAHKPALKQQQTARVKKVIVKVGV